MFFCWLPFSISNLFVCLFVINAANCKRRSTEKINSQTKIDFHTFPMLAGIVKKPTQQNAQPVAFWVFPAHMFLSLSGPVHIFLTGTRKKVSHRHKMQMKLFVLTSKLKQFMFFFLFVFLMICSTFESIYCFWMGQRALLAIAFNNNLCSRIVFSTAGTEEFGGETLICKFTCRSHKF